MADLRDVYGRLLGRQYQKSVFADLRDQKQQGRETVATCPFCGKKQKFSFASDKPLWRCWSCGRAGDWITYLEIRQGLDFRGALEQLAKEAGVELSVADKQRSQEYARKADLLEAADRVLIEALHSPEGQDVYEYLTRRGYSAADIDAMHLGAYASPDTLKPLCEQYTDEEIRQAGLFTKGYGTTHRLTLVWRDLAGRAVGLVARSLLSDQELKAAGEQKYKYSWRFKAGENLLGIERLRGSRSAVLVEGVLDTPYIAAQGVPMVSTGGTNFNTAHISLLERVGVSEVLLLFDRDEAGQKAIDRALQTLQKSGSLLRPYVVSLPEGFKDPDELVRKRGLGALQKCLDRAENWAAWQARYIARQHDMNTDRGLETAVDQALAAYNGLRDPVDRMQFKQSLLRVVPLDWGDIEARQGRLAEQEALSRNRALLSGLINDLQQKASEGAFLEAELALEAGLQEIRGNRVSIPEPYTAEDFRADIQTMTEGLRTGWGGLDNLGLRIPEGAVTLVAGRPSHGKTAFLINLLFQLVVNYPDRRFYFFSYEEARARLAVRLLMLIGGQVLDAHANYNAHLSYLRERTGTNENISDALARYERFTSMGRLWLLDKRLTAEDLGATIAELCQRGVPGAFLVDYIQKVPVRKPQPQRYLDVKQVSDILLAQAVSQNVPIVMGAQLGRATGMSDKVRLDNLREAGDLEQDASLVLGLFNPAMEKAQGEEQKETKEAVVDLQVSILKNRVGAGTGRPPVCLRFNRATQRITDGNDKTGNF